MARIHIENLRIKLPRSMRGEARTVGASIAQDVARSLAGVAKGRTGTIRIDAVSAGRVQSVNQVAAHAAEKVNGVLNSRSKK